MTKQYPEITRDILKYIKELKQYVPDVMQGSYNLSQAAFQDGAVDKKTKEMFALALAVATRCDGCIGFHAEALVKLGATRQEVAEMLGVAVYMGGGPSLMTAAEAIKAFEQFEELHSKKIGVIT
jgi:AhpD family alkylhydroperoxidase